MSPLERAARALAERNDSAYWRGYVGDVQAVLEAIREPTEGMTGAAVYSDLDIYWGYSADGRPGGPEDVWRAMVDAALAEVPAKAAPERMAEEPPQNAEQAIVQALQGAQWFLMDEITDDFDRAREVAKLVIPANSDGGFTATEWITAKYAAAFKDGQFLIRWDFEPLAPGETVSFRFGGWT